MMDLICVNFCLKSLSSFPESKELFEQVFQTVYKPAAKFLYSHPDFPMTFSFSGAQMLFFRKRHPEFIALLQELISRKQIEILGGGFYDPPLPLLYPVDRNGQIDMMTSELRQTTGKRPRGIFLFADCWDSSLVTNLQTCGIEYVVLDAGMIPDAARKYQPVYMSELGKSVEIFPYYGGLCPADGETPEQYVARLRTEVGRSARVQGGANSGVRERVVTVCLSCQEAEPLVRKNWFQELEEFIGRNGAGTVLTNTAGCRKNSRDRIPYYIPAGINSGIAKWIARAFTESEPKDRRPYTVYDFMRTYPQSRALYSRILYVSMLVNQYKADKMRKKSAREKLWEAQNGTALLCSADGVFSNSRCRQQSYKLLMEAEQILRDDTQFKESISCFDYNGDGFNEYVCRMQDYFSIIELTGGALQELDLVKSMGNYADNLSRIQEFDGITDGYRRGIFIDHLFTDQQFSRYVGGSPAGDGVFSGIRYSELKFSPAHHEIQLEASAVCMPGKQRVHLKKRYVINSAGMNVQYIIKNAGERRISMKFAVESNFADTDFGDAGASTYRMDAVDNGSKVVIDAAENPAGLYAQDRLLNVSAVRLTDSAAGISFSFEPNENCGCLCRPIVFMRPDFSSAAAVPVSMTMVSTLFWNIDIEPGMETEKTINFTIAAPVKTKRRLR